MQNQEGYPHEGHARLRGHRHQHFIGHDRSCGRVFDNKDQLLFPGLFARVRIPLGEPKPMLVVPASAIGNDQEGDYVLVVDAGDVVARRAVVKGPLTDQRLRHPERTQPPQDRVIVNGIMRAKPGAKVTPVTAADRPAAPAR